MKCHIEILFWNQARLRSVMFPLACCFLRAAGIFFHFRIHPLRADWLLVLTNAIKLDERTPPKNMWTIYIILYYIPMEKQNPPSRVQLLCQPRFSLYLSSVRLYSFHLNSFILKSWFKFRNHPTKFRFFFSYLLEMTEIFKCVCVGGSLYYHSI